MRRFEFVEGTSAKFWEVTVEGNLFVVAYGRLGTAGQRKEKTFPDSAAALREMNKKISEKLREGYHEVASDAAAQVPAGAKGANAATPRLLLPDRVPRSTPTPEQIERAVTALTALEAQAGRRSWIVAHKARHARRALEALGGYDPAAHPAMVKVFDALMVLAAAPADTRWLPLPIAMGLLVKADIAAFERALKLWESISPTARSRDAIAMLRTQRQILGVPELALRLGGLLTERPAAGGAETAWCRRLCALLPHLQAHLAATGTSLKKHLATIDPGRDCYVTQRLAVFEKQSLS